MTTASSYVIDFGASDTALSAGEAPAYKARTCPSQLAINQAFRVIVQGPAGYFIRWPYSELLVEQTPVNEAYSDHIDLSGSDIIETYAPIAILTSVTADNDIVDGDPILYQSAGQPIPATVELGRLKLQKPLWGTVKIDYSTHTQSWECATGLPDPGEYAVQIAYSVTVMYNGSPTGQTREITAMLTFHVDGVPSNIGRTDFCSDLGGGGV